MWDNISVSCYRNSKIFWWIPQCINRIGEHWVHILGSVCRIHCTITRPGGTSAYPKKDSTAYEIQISILDVIYYDLLRKVRWDSISLAREISVMRRILNMEGMKYYGFSWPIESMMRSAAHQSIRRVFADCICIATYQGTLIVHTSITSFPRLK